jgi:hypothetical protein
MSSFGTTTIERNRPARKCGKGNQHLEALSGFVTIEHLLFGQDISPKANINTEIGMT